MRFQVLDEMKKAWEPPLAGDRLDAAKDGAMRLRQRLRDGPRVQAVRTLDLATFPYPTRFAFWGACSLPYPFTILTHRANVVQFEQGGDLKTLLVNPTDAKTAQDTPFFAKLRKRYGDFLSDRVLSRTHDPLDAQLRALGVAPEDVDYATFDHLHTQDLRPLAERFPNATFLLRRSEVDSMRNLHPTQASWYIREGLDGVPRDRFALLDEDVLLGDGVALVATPGHTVGNQTVVLHTSTGLWTVSENAVASECYAPLLSKLPGLAEHARTYGHGVILNANTLEGTADQYTSCVVERILADGARDRPAFPQCFPSSEFTGSRLFPGLKPTFEHRAITDGDLTTSAR